MIMTENPLEENLEEKVDFTPTGKDHLLFGVPEALAGFAGAVAAGYSAYNYLRGITYSTLAVVTGTGAAAILGMLAAKVVVATPLAILSKRAHDYYTRNLH
jgi:uncharacterized membrane protein